MSLFGPAETAVWLASDRVGIEDRALRRQPFRLLRVSAEPFKLLAVRLLFFSSSSLPVCVRSPCGSATGIDACVPLPMAYMRLEPLCTQHEQVAERNQNNPEVLNRTASTTLPRKPFDCACVQASDRIIFLIRRMRAGAGASARFEF